MGGWDFYCAICGGPLSRPYMPDEQDQEYVYTYDRTIIGVDDPKMEWLSRFRVLCEAPFEGDDARPWISGPASAADYGQIDMEDSEEDPAFGGQTAMTNAYEDLGDYPLSIPFHDDCLQVLLHHLGEKKIDKEIFYDAVHSIGTDGSSRLNIKYGDINEAQSQYWATNRGEEYFVFSPIDDPDLKELYLNLPKLDNSGSSQQESGDARNTSPTGSDSFSKMAPEILTSIMLNMDFETMKQLRSTSPTVRNVALTNSFWHQRLERDMPYLFDMPESVAKNKNIDWEQAYKKIFLASDPDSKSIIRGLANRRRIWEQPCPQIAAKYQEKQRNRERARLEKPLTLDGASSTRAARLVVPDPRDTKVVETALLSDVRDLSSVRPWIKASFNEFGLLVGIDADYMEEDMGKVLGGPRRPCVRVPGNDWITGFIVTTKEGPRLSAKEDRTQTPVGLEVLFAKRGSESWGETDGDKRLIYTPNDHFAVGFRTHIAPSGVVAKFSLLTHESWKAGSNSRRFTSDSYIHDYDVTKYTWRKELPPPRMPVSKPASGYWVNMETDVSPLEPLIFGDSPAQLGNITGISADVQFGGFQITYADRAPRVIGPRHQAMKTLKIDHTKGERIVTAHFNVNHIPTALRLVTNRGRQLIIGRPTSRAKMFPEPPPEGQPLAPLTGLYGWWSARDFPGANLDALGFFSHHSPFAHNPVPELSLQTEGFYWEPCGLPASIVEDGPILGEREIKKPFGHRSTNVPADCPVINWVECSRPVSQVRVTLCHSLKTREIPLSGITFEYSDEEGGEASIGPSSFPWTPQDTEGTNGHHKCWCALGFAKVEEEMAARPHYFHDTWNVGGKRLQSLRVWIVKSASDKVLDRDSISAIQLEAEGGQESPVWRSWNHTADEAEVHEIKFEGGAGKAVGIKCFVGENGRSVTREDSTVQAIQALKRAN